MTFIHNCIISRMIEHSTFQSQWTSGKSLYYVKIKKEKQRDTLEIEKLQTVYKNVTVLIDLNLYGIKPSFISRTILT